MTDNIFRLECKPRFRVIEQAISERERQERIAHAARAIEEAKRMLIHLLPEHEVRAMKLELRAQMWGSFAAIHEWMAHVAGDDDDPGAA